jgi:hypothetical protein
VSVFSARTVLRVVLGAIFLVAACGYIFGPSAAQFLTACIAFIAAVVGYFSLVQTRDLARKKATLDLIEGSESKEYYQDRYTAYLTFRRASRADREQIANPDNRDPTCDALRSKCQDFLNHYELVAIAGKQGLLDLDFYRDWMGPNLVRDWNEAEILVNRARGVDRPGDRGNPAAFENFERLAVSWGGRPLCKK